MHYSRRTKWSGIVTAALLLCAGAATYVWRQGGTPPAPAVQPPPVPVTVVEARQMSFPVYLDSLGTMQPLNTVQLRSRVDGTIVRLAFKEGQIVNAGDLLVQIDPRPFQAQLDQATAKKSQDEANLQNATLDLQRYDTLVKSQTGSRQQRDTQASQVAQLKALVQADAAAIESARLQVEYAAIRAPISGRVSFANVTLGNVVHAADTTSIVSIVQVQPISVVFTEPEQELPAINRAFSAGPVDVTALTSDGKQTLAHGVLSVLNNQIDATSGTIQLKATFENKDNTLWPGMSVTTRLLVRTLDRALVVPDKAIERGPDGFYLYVIDQQNKAMRHNVEVGPMADGQAVIESGISAGDRIVTEGQYRLNNGVAVAANDQTPATAHAASRRSSVSED